METGLPPEVIERFVELLSVHGDVSEEDLRVVVAWAEEVLNRNNLLLAVLSGQIAIKVIDGEPAFKPLYTSPFSLN